MKKAVFGLIYFLFLCLLVEGSARLVFSIKPLASRLINLHESYSWQRLWVKRYQKGREIYYQFDLYDATKGWVPKPNLRNMAVFDQKVLNTNAKGLRGTTDFAYEKKNPRILLLGDSFTFGDEVSDHETYAHYLQELLPEYDVINMGVHGYGHDQMLLYFEQEGARYQPDIVILGFVAQDMERNVLFFRDFAKPMFKIDHRVDALRLTHVPVPSPEDVLRCDWRRPRIVELGALLTCKIRRRNGAFQRQKLEVTRRILRRIVQKTLDIGAQPILFYLPVSDEIALSDPQTSAEIFLDSFCQTMKQVICFSTRPVFQNRMRQGRPFNVESGGHWGPKANAVIAEIIAEHLKH